MTDIPGNSSTTARIGVGDTTTGSLEVIGDRDWYRIELSAGQQISIDLSGYGSTPVEDTYLRVRDASGNIIYENDDIVLGTDRDSSLAFSAPSSGTYFIEVGAFDDFYSGGYQLEVSAFQMPPVGNMDLLADQLVSGYWNGDSHHYNVSQGGTITVNLTALTGQAQTLARAALALWTDIIGVTFREVSTGGQMTFDDNLEGAFADASWSADGITSSAHVNVSADWVARYGTSLNSYSFQTYIHEIGHALGLGHAGSYNGDGQYPYDVVYQVDGWPASVMSYFDQRESSYWGDQGFTVNFLATPMMADILAMAELYGLSTTTRTGNTTYGFNSNANRDVFNASLYPNAAVTIFDSGGVDTLDYSGYSTSQHIDLNDETFSNVGSGVGNLSIARGVTIENAIGGSGNDTLVGNSANNVLNGGSGNDTIRGGAGSDTFSGERGRDTLTGGAGNDTIRDTASSLSGDTITDFSAGDRIVITDADIDSFDFSLSGTTLTYSGGSLAFGAALSGTLVASAAQGGGVQLTIGNVVSEDKTLVGSAADDILDAGDGSDRLYGRAGDDRLFGNAGNDTLDGGAGLDRMYGGLGNDIYMVTDSTDYAYEYAGEGTDRVYSTVSHVLRSNVEELRLQGDAAINGYGGSDANLIIGNSAANKLNGWGGDDRLYGGDGNDRLYGTDGDDRLLGEAGADRLDGGAGDDRMYGGGGNDIYIVRDSTDYALEDAGAGMDTVYASVSHVLRANVETLRLTGSAAINGWGSDGDDSIVGNSGANRLYGEGGDDRLFGEHGDDRLYGREGNDRLDGGRGMDLFYGGTGADDFLFRSGDFASAGRAGADRILDFSKAEGDQLHLSAVDADATLSGDQAFAFLGTGAFTGSAGELRYEQVSGNTYVSGDTDGDGSADFTVRIDGLHALDSGDFIL